MADNYQPSEAQGDDKWTNAPLPDGVLPFDPDAVPSLAPKWSAPLADAPAEGLWSSFEQINISCTMTMCEDDLHCFRLTKAMSKVLSQGSCRECGKALVSLERTAQRDLRDIDATFAALQVECIRHYFWHVPFGQKALDYAVRAGRRTLESRIESRIRSRIGKAQPYKDGQQTPTSHDRANALDFAQHAVAACCRKCVNYWHGIPMGRPLADDEVAYLSELVRRYLRARLAWLSDDPQRVPTRLTTSTVASINPLVQDRAVQSHAS